MRHKVYTPLQCQHRDIKPIRLRCKLEIGMDIDASDAKSVRRQRFHRRINNIIAQSDMNLTRRGSGHTMASSNNMTTWNKRTSTSENTENSEELKEICIASGLGWHIYLPWGAYAYVRLPGERPKSCVIPSNYASLGCLLCQRYATTYIYIYICKLQIMHRVHPYYITPKIYLVKYLITVTNLFS